MKNIIKIGTRKSKLALIQTDIVKDKIKKAFPEIEVEIVKIDTKGDQILDKSRWISQKGLESVQSLTERM